MMENDVLHDNSGEMNRWKDALSCCRPEIMIRWRSTCILKEEQIIFILSSSLDTSPQSGPFVIREVVARCRLNSFFRYG